jgi:hypothetical protein
MEFIKARILIKNCINHAMYGTVGLGDQPPPHFECESLKDILEANDVIEKWNNSEDSKTEEGRSRLMTIADRGIAAVFTAMHFEGGTPDEPNIVGYANGNYVLVISERSLKKH